MNAQELLADLASHGVLLRRKGDRLRLEATEEPLTQELIARIRPHKAELLFAIDRRPRMTSPNDRTVAEIVETWPEEDRLRFGERAAIREYDGGMERSAAERAALADLARLRDHGERVASYRDSP